MKKIMVVAGGDWQIELVKKAKEMGYYVICSNLYEDSPAFSYADVGEVADVLDKQRNLEIAKKYMPDAVITDQSDIAVPTVAYLCEQLGLRGIGREKADVFTDKSMLRKFCKVNNITVPEFRVCKSYFDAEKMLEKYNKIVIKPIDSQSSRGVYTITTPDELQMYYKETVSYSNRRKEFLAEEYVGGDEFTIDGLVVGGRHYPLCISIKEMYNNDFNVSKVQTYTYSHPKYDYDELRMINRELIEKLELPFGLTHTEYKYYKGKYYLLEAAARGGGTNLSGKIVPFMSKVDNYEFYIKSALGEKIDDTPLKNLKLPKERCAIMRFFDFGSGKIKKIHGEDVLEKCEAVLDYQIKVKEGECIEIPEYGSQRAGHYTIAGEDFMKLQKQDRELQEKVHVDFESCIE